ncbi:type 4a pilus biogenesis protein PilO [Tepidibacillus marianensis]|uniref:type 4a pilus biogenesis protein PilO n=1 Tax=Tepidibacillus marianensis TaxID=3131995 RepID=UPI0030D4261E
MTEGRKALLIILVFFIVMGSFYFYRTAGLNRELKQLNADITKEQDFLQNVQQQETQLKKQPKIEDVIKYAEALPAEGGNAQILQYFHQVAKKNNIQILTIDFDDNKQNSEGSNVSNNTSNTTASEDPSNPNPSKAAQPNDSGVKTIKINLTVKGDFNQLRFFVADIYRSSRIINLSNWQWAVTGNAPVVQMSFKTYYYPDLENELPRLKPIPTYEPSNRSNPT